MLIWLLTLVLRLAHGDQTAELFDQLALTGERLPVIVRLKLDPAATQRRPRDPDAAEAHRQTLINNAQQRVLDAVLQTRALNRQRQRVQTDGAIKRYRYTPLLALDVDAEQGTRYAIALDGYDGASGVASLSLLMDGARPPDNDNFAAAATLQTTARASNVAAGLEPGEPPHAGLIGGRSLWWRWRADADGVEEFNTQGSSFDTVLAVYTGASLGQLSEVASNDDLSDSRRAGLSRDSALSLHAAAGACRQPGGARLAALIAAGGAACV